MVILPFGLVPRELPIQLIDRQVDGFEEVVTLFVRDKGSVGSRDLEFDRLAMLLMVECDLNVHFAVFEPRYTSKLVGRVFF